MKMNTTANTDGKEIFICSITDIDESDCGCEGIPDGEEPKAGITAVFAAGNRKKRIYVPERILYESGCDENMSLVKKGGEYFLKKPDGNFIEADSRLAGALLFSGAVLASASPRRRELMRLITDDFTAVAADIDESVHADKRPSSVPLLLAQDKACAAAENYENGYIIGCDTVVLYGAEYGENTDPMTARIYENRGKKPPKVLIGGEIMGKPADEADAERMLKKLSGSTHHVITGCCIISKHSKSYSKTVVISETTEVEFYRLSPAEIKSYIRSGEPMDKAGAYGIQGGAAVFVKRINGCYNNVVGLPAALLKREFENLVVEDAEEAAYVAEKNMQNDKNQISP